MDDYLETLIGVPYKPLGRDKEGLDCWGFVQLVYKKLGIILPDFVYTEYGRSKVETIEEELRNNCRRWQELNTPEPFCVVAMGKTIACSHVGVWHPSEIVFHAAYPVGVRFHSIEKLNEFGIRNIKFYKWSEFCA